MNAGWKRDRDRYDLRLASTLVLTVVREIQSRDNPSPTPYRAMIFGATLKARFATADEAKKAALAFAKMNLKRASDHLETMELALTRESEN